jgi:hypothetical protein
MTPLPRDLTNPLPARRLPFPAADEWGFSTIALDDPERAARLAAAGSPDLLISEVCKALDLALAASEARVGFDWKGTVISTWRTTFQLRVDERLYDWFFNSRTGYRAHFWHSCEAGLAFNAQMVIRLRAVIERQLTGSDVRGHKVRVDPHDRRHALSPKSLV